MAETVACSYCGKENRLLDDQCKYCDADLISKTVEDPVYASTQNDLTDLGTQLDDQNRFYEDEFAVLDYRPKSIRGFLVPVTVILLAFLIVMAGVFLLNNDDSDPQAEEKEFGLPGTDESKNDLDDATSDEFEDIEPEPELKPDPEEDEPRKVEEISPDYDQLEAALFNWLINRIGDPHVIMLSVEKVDDVNKFFERYNPEEENIIIYEIESKDDEFVTVLFGPPFSEWLIQVVFIWDQSEWRFLREEAFQ